MEILLLFIFFIIAICILGHLSHNINMKRKGVRNFICDLSSEHKIYLVKILIYVFFISSFLLISRRYAYYTIEYFTFVIFVISFLVGDLNKFFHKVREKVNRFFSPIFSKIIISFVSLFILVVLNEYVSENIAISFSSFSITSSIITFLFSIAYLGTILLLIIALFIELLVLIDLFKIEKLWVKIIQYIYNMLSDSQHINVQVGLETKKDYKYIFPTGLHVVRFFLLLIIIENNKVIINQPDRLIEEIILSTSYTAIPDRCSNLYEYRDKHALILFIDIDNVSLAIPNLDDVTVTKGEKNGNNSKKYKFTVDKCEKFK